MAEATTVTEVGPGVFFVEGPASNWIVLVGDDSVTLVDAGYPEDLDLVERSMRETSGGKPLTDIIVTHGHSDHIGSIPALLARRRERDGQGAEGVERGGVRVWAAADEIPNVQREVLHQVGIGDLLPSLWRPRYLRWALHAIRAGGLRPLEIRDVRALAPDEPVVFSGHTLVPHVTPGHTPGHLVLAVPSIDALITGDAIITAHATTTPTGRQVLPRMWHWNPDRAAEEARGLLGDPRIVLPGHGALETRESRRS